MISDHVPESTDMGARPSRPMDAVLRDRLHLSDTARLSLALVRAGIHAVDGVSRLFTGQPLFALRECEALMRRIDGMGSAELVQYILDRNGGTSVNVRGLEHIPDKGPIVIASTHPTGMFDFVAHAKALLDKRPELKVVANQEVERFLGADAIVAVRINKQNRSIASRETFEAMQAHLRAGGALLIFGSGRVPNRCDGRLVEPAWRIGATRVSQSCQVPVIPASLNARNSEYYYRIRQLAQWISRGNDDFGAMVGSLRYVAEMLDKLGGRFDVVYGTPQPSGTAPGILKTRAEGLVPGLYRAP